MGASHRGILAGVLLLVAVLVHCTTLRSSSPRLEPSIPVRQTPPAPRATSVMVTLDFRVPVLMYHRVDNLDARQMQTRSIRDLTVSPADFERQMRYLVEHGFTVVSTREAADAVRNRGPLPAKAVAITLDDGYADNYEHAYPVMRRYGVPATVFVVTARIGDGRHISWHQATEMRDGGVLIEPHTASHPDLSRLPAERVDSELRASMNKIEEKLGEPATSIAYPDGRCTRTVAPIARSCGYTSAWKKNGGIVHPRRRSIHAPTRPREWLCDVDRLCPARREASDPQALIAILPRLRSPHDGYNGQSLVGRWRIAMRFGFVLIMALMLAGAARAELVMELSTPKTHYVQHEPFWVVLTFRNTGTQDERLVRWFSTASDRVTYYVTPPDGKEYLYNSIVNGDWFEPDWDKLTVCLAPGDKFTAEADLTFEMRLIDEKKRDFLFADTISRPGEYRMRAKYRMPGPNPTTLESSECTFTVEEAKGIDKKVYDLLKKIPMWQGGETLWMSDHDSHALALGTWQQIVSQYPKSAYAPNALLNLAGYYQRDSFSREPKRKGRPDGAARLYEKCADGSTDMLFAVEALSWAVSNYRKAGDRDQARRVFVGRLACPGMTDEQRLRSLAFLYMEGAKPPVADSDDVRAPIRPIAESMGFRVAWNPQDKTAEVSNARLHIVVGPEDISMKDGRMMVPLNVLAPLAADRYGRRCETGSTIDKTGP